MKKKFILFSPWLLQSLGFDIRAAVFHNTNLLETSLNTDRV